MAHNLKAIAEAVGVSQTTVSRVLNNYPHVTQAVRDKVFDAALKLGYQPRLSSEKKRLAIIINDRNNDLFGIYDNKMLFQLITECTHRNITTEIFGLSNMNLLDENFLKVGIFFQEFLQEEDLRRYPHARFVGINNPIPGTMHVCSDDYQGLKLAFDYFKNTGHRKIALILPDDVNIRSIMVRKRIFCQLSRQHGEPDPESLVAYLYSEHSLEKISIMLRVHKPDALLIGGEDMCLRVNYILAMLGVTVPDDLSVISFENLLSSRYMIPPHTTIRQNFEHLAATAVEFAFQLLENPQLENKSVVLPDDLIERDSVKKRFYGQKNKSSD